MVALLGGFVVLAQNATGSVDPHGWILSIVSVSVVFASLAVLWFLFSMLFKPRMKKTPSVKSVDVTPEVAAAIAMALDMEEGGETYAAVAMAMHLYMNDAVHDKESLVITIRRSGGSGWNDKSDNFRKSPR